MPNSDNIRQYLSQVLNSQEHMLAQSREEFGKFEQPDLSSFDVLSIRAFMHSYAGMHDAALADLKALAARKAGQTPRILNKLSQELLRAGGPENIAQVVPVSNQVLALDGVSPGELWLAHHNIALAFLADSDFANAEEHENEALKQVDDPRSHMVLEFIRSQNKPAAGALADLTDDMAGLINLPAKEQRYSIGFFAMSEREI